MVIAQTALNAQDSARITIYNTHFFLFDKQSKSSVYEVDTLLNNVPNYSMRNRMGSIGVPDYSLLLRNKEYDLGALWFRSGYDREVMALQEDAYFSNKKIATSIYGAAGTQKEQVLKLFHVQNVNEHLNFTLKLNRLTSTNFYQFQQGFVNNLLFSSHYINPKSRISYLAKFTFDRYKHQENGGITADSVLINDSLGKKILLPVNLNSAKRNYRVMAGETKLFFKLNKDSLSYRGHYISMGANGSITKSEYNDIPDFKFYANTFKNNFVTHDSVRFSKFTPGAAYNYMGKGFSATLGGLYDVSRMSINKDTSKVYQSIIAEQTMAWMSADSNLTVKQRFNYIVNGYNSGDYKGTINMNYNLDFLKSVFAIKIQTENRNPDLFYNYYSSNNYYWDSSFQKNKSNLIDVNVNLSKLRLQFGTCINNQSNMIILGNNAAPMQLNTGVTAMRFYLHHTLKVFRFYFVNKLNYQSSNSYAWALPQVFTQHQLFYQHKVKRNGMILQAGIQADYVGAMDKIKYNPALNSFVMEYANEQGGNYVFADVFFTLRFMDVSFFFKTEHINQGFSGYNYSLLQNYYQRDRAFRFGLQWNFRD